MYMSEGWHAHLQTPSNQDSQDTRSQSCSRTQAYQLQAVHVHSSPLHTHSFISTRHSLMACSLQASGIHFMYSARILGYSGSGGCTVSWQNLYTAPKTAMSPACQHLCSSLDPQEHDKAVRRLLLIRRQQQLAAPFIQSS